MYIEALGGVIQVALLEGSDFLKGLKISSEVQVSKEKNIQATGRLKIDLHYKFEQFLLEK
jgi:hypothetical protein